MNDYELFEDRLSGFFRQCLTMGYDYDGAWSLALNSEEGRGLLERDYTFFIHFLGAAVAVKANDSMGSSYDRSFHIKVNMRVLMLLADLIYRAHEQFKMRYEDIFKKMSPNNFMETCGNILGNYDDKLIKTYLL